MKVRFLFLILVGLSVGQLCAQSSVGRDVLNSYNALVYDQGVLIERVSTMESELVGLRGSKARRVAKELAECRIELESLSRRIASYPLSVREPGNAVENKPNLEFEERLNKLIELRLAGMEKLGDTKLSGDEELERNYRTYLERIGELPVYDSFSGEELEFGSGIIYRVMLGTSGEGLDLESFNGIEGIVEQRVGGSLGVVYYEGNYSNRLDAEASCLKIQAHRGFPGAVVVAMCKR